MEIVKKCLKHVMNPLTGLDIVRTELIKDIEIKDGIIRVVVDLPENHQFAPAIKEDITDKLEHLWDVKNVVVAFTD